MTTTGGDERALSACRNFDFAVVGAGPAGVAAARLLAERVGPGKVALIGNENCIPYERPALSKAALKSGAEAIPRICSAEEFEALGLAFIRTRVNAIARDERLVRTDGGSLGYGQLLLATGASPIRLDVPGDRLSGVFYLRTAADAEAIRRELEGHPRIVVIGGGFIGLEVAATARAMGCEVVVVTKGAHLMARCMPGLIAGSVASLLEADGIGIRFNSDPVAIEGTERAKAVRIANGESILADIVVIGIGAAPDTGLAAAAGLDVEDGIIVDERWRTSDPHIYAAGDVARRRIATDGIDHPGVRLESWEPAIENGQLAALAMLGEPVEEPGVPWMWSDQHDINIQIAGNPDPSGVMVVRAVPERQGVSAAFFDGDRITGAITVNDGRSMALFRRAIAERRVVDQTLLADTTTELKSALGMRRGG